MELQSDHQRRTGPSQASAECLLKAGERTDTGPAHTLSVERKTVSVISSVFK